MSLYEEREQLAVPRYAPIWKPLPIPSSSWDDSPCVCLAVNEEWVGFVIGVLDVLDQPDAWKGTTEEIDAARANVVQIKAAFMACCTQTAIPLTRIDNNGHYQQSDDGGATWHDAPQYDPRNAIPELPPNPTVDTTGAKCAYADSVVQTFKIGVIDVVTEGQTAEEIAAVITGIAGTIFGPLGGPIGWLVPLIFAIGTAIVALSVTAVQAAFTTPVWDALRCLIFDNINDDGTFTQDQMDTIWNNLPSDPIVIFVLHSWLAFLGTKGMTQTAHNGKGSVEADCDCSSTCDLDNWTVVFGTEVSRTSNTIIVSPTFNAPDSKWHGQIAATDPDQCCYIEQEGAIWAEMYWDCGTPPPADPSSTTSGYGASHLCCFTDAVEVGAGSNVTFTFSAEPFA